MSEKTYRFSVVIPAHNEEKYIKKCICGICRAAKAAAPDKVQIIVVANRCTDRTAEIAGRCGAEVIENYDRHISRIRNAGAARAKGEILVTVDADSVMTKGALCEIRDLLGTGKYIGGGSSMKFDRMSLGIAVSAGYIALHLLPRFIKNRSMLSGGMFWCRKEDFEAIGGFDTELVSMEDMDFAERLSQYGKLHGKKYGTLRHSHIVTSARKFDELGDWYLLKNRHLTKRIFTGKDRSAADEFYYDVRDSDSQHT